MAEHFRHLLQMPSGISRLRDFEVPILGFLSVTAVWFLSLSPGRVLGAELACVFARKFIRRAIRATSPYRSRNFSAANNQSIPS
jgi:hypothetical protein